MPNFDASRRFNGENRHLDHIDDSLAPDKDLVMEQILENLNTTPIGQVLKRIASLPENRKEKILNVRRQITEGNYELNEHLDIALEKVLGELKE